MNAAEQIAGPAVQVTTSFASSSAGQAVIAIVTIVNVTIMIGLAGYCYRKDRKRRAKQKKNRYVLIQFQNIHWNSKQNWNSRVLMMTVVPEEWGT